MNTSFEDVQIVIDPPFPLYQKALEITFFSLISIVSLLGNFQLWTVILTRKSLRTLCNMLVLSLSCSDLFNALIVIPALIPNIINNGLAYSTAWCSVFGFIALMAAIGSMMTISIISINRYILICHSDKASIFTTKVTVSIIIGTWFLSACVALPPFLGWGVYAFVPLQSSCLVTYSESLSYTFFLITVCFVCPCTVCSFSYYNIIKHVRDSRRRVEQALNENTRQKKTVIEKSVSKKSEIHFIKQDVNGPKVIIIEVHQNSNMSYFEHECNCINRNEKQCHETNYQRTIETGSKCRCAKEVVSLKSINEPAIEIENVESNDDDIYAIKETPQSSATNSKVPENSNCGCCPGTSRGLQQKNCKCWQETSSIMANHLSQSSRKESKDSKSQLCTETSKESKKHNNQILHKKSTKQYEEQSNPCTRTGKHSKGKECQCSLGTELQDKKCELYTGSHNDSIDAKSQLSHGKIDYSQSEKCQLCQGTSAGGNNEKSQPRNNDQQNERKEHCKNLQNDDQQQNECSHTGQYHSVIQNISTPDQGKKSFIKTNEKSNGPNKDGVKSLTSKIRKNKSQNRKGPTKSMIQMTFCVLAIIIWLIVTETPYVVVTILGMFGVKIPRVVEVISLMLVYTNFACNPIIYGLLNKRIGGEYKKLITKACKVKCR